MAGPHLRPSDGATLRRPVAIYPEITVYTPDRARLNGRNRARRPGQIACGEAADFWDWERVDGRDEFARGDNHVAISNGIGVGERNRVLRLDPNPVGLDGIKRRGPRRQDPTRRSGREMCGPSSFTGGRTWSNTRDPTCVTGRS
jgi:hypothetical protein